MILFRSKTLALAACLCTLVSSEPGFRPRHNPHNVWVTVDASGDAQTITPAVSGTKTISGAPEYVTQTSVYTMTTAEGVVRTSTGMAPVATATAISGAGAFFQCGNFQGLDAPFCQPRRGSVLRPGDTYYSKSRMLTPKACLDSIGKRWRLIRSSHLGHDTIRQ